VLQKVEKCEESFCTREREELLSKQTSEEFWTREHPERERESKKKNSNNKKKANSRSTKVC
jgi:hypothetical protein